VYEIFCISCRNIPKQSTKYFINYWFFNNFTSIFCICRITKEIIYEKNHTFSREKSVFIIRCLSQNIVNFIWNIFSKIFQIKKLYNFINKITIIYVTSIDFFSKNWFYNYLFRFKPLLYETFSIIMHNYL